MALRQSGEFVWTIKYSHKNGDDVTVYDSEASALDSAVEIMREGAKSWSNDEQEIKDFEELMAKNPYEAMNKFSEGITGDNEFIDIDNKEIWTSKTNIDSLKEAIDDAGKTTG